MAPVVLILLIIHFFRADFGSTTTQDMIESVPGLEIESNETDPRTGRVPSSCPTLPGMDDILVVIKTGITEAQDKVPVHLRTTLRCIPNKIIVSDFEEDIAGVRTYDVFRNVSDTLKQSSEDFAIYNRARTGGRTALTSQDHLKVANGPSGMMDNPGWKLDKWKFLPMIQTARHVQPDAKWFIFLEADTYPIWTNLLGWLSHFNPEDRLYLGNQMQIGANLFAHGGSGFALSHAAIHSVADLHALHTEEWEKITDREWAGDCVLGMALAVAGVPLTWSWPHVTTQSVWEQDMLHEAFAKQPWCYAPFTFHHMTPADVDRFYEFEQQWFAEVIIDLSPILSLTMSLTNGPRQTRLCLHTVTSSETSSAQLSLTTWTTGTTSPRRVTTRKTTRVPRRPPLSLPVRTTALQTQSASNTA
jgi:hypothetical protein